MRISVTGFPRIGKNREWKKSLESYWKGEISREQLVQNALDLQKEHYRFMEQLDSIPLDFAFYDHVLETAWTVGIVPRDINRSSLHPIDQYFALARGYQSKELDIKPWPMKKWFFTNYHYVVPKITSDTSFEVNTFFLEQKLAISRAFSKPSRVVLVGPYTLWKLRKSERDDEEVKDLLIGNYLSVLNTVQSEDILIQLDEPALVLTMTEQDKALFLDMYKKLLAQKKDILLQTYFGDIRDIYREVIQLPLTGIGLDFVDGKQSLSLLKEYGFPSDKLLFAGIVSGRNIWKTDYREALSLVKDLHSFVSDDKLLLSTSCSLLHVPYTCEGESLPPEIQRVLAFGLEKISELSDIAFLFSCVDPEKEKLWQDNQRYLQEFSRFSEKKEVRERVASLTPSHFHRELPVEKRLPLQRQHLKLPLFPTTTIGSFPQTSALRQLRRRYNEKECSHEEYKRELQDMIKNCIREQESLGLDVLVHGEFERNDMVEYFASYLDGCLTTKNGWVQSYGSRATKPPIIYGDITRIQAMTVEWITYAQSLTQKPVKAILTGPITIINWSFCREDRDLQETAYQIALAIRNEIEELQRAGISIIQLDEAALREKLPLRKEEWKAYLDIATSAFRLATGGIKSEVQLHTHMCYSEFSDIADAIEALDADVLTIEASRSEFSVLESLRDYSQKRDIGPGVYDIHSPRIPSVEEIRRGIEQLLRVIPSEHLWINPDCGLKTRTPQEALESLANMVKAAQELRSQW